MAEINDNKYDSNPFTLSFGALGRFFNSNSAWAITIIALAIFGFLFQMGSNIAQIASRNDNSSSVNGSSISTSPDPTVIAAIVIFVSVLVLAFIVVATVIKIYVSGMFTYVALQSEKEKPVDFREAFDAVSRRFWRFLWADFLANLKILGWTLLLIVPGIVASLRYSMLPYIIMSESASEKGINDAHLKAKVVSKGRLVEVFGVRTVAAMIPVIGQLIGLSGKAALFNQLNYFNQNNIEKPKVHWLNYLGFILLGVLLLIIVLAAGIIILAAASSN